MNSPPQKRDKERLSAEERRESILEAASTVFAEHGYHQSTIEEIAQTAGVSKALIYEHFQSKNDLHRTLIEASCRDLIERLAESAPAEKPTEFRLREGLDAFFKFVEERGKAWRVLYRDSSDPELVEVIKSARELVIAAVATLFYEVPPDGRLSPEERKLEDDMHSLLIVGAADTLGNWWQDHKDVPRDTLVERVMEMAWLGFERLLEGEEWSSTE